MKYSELKSYLELAHWENESDDNYIKVYRNGHTVAAVGLLEQYSIRILDPTQMTEGLYRRLSDFARTPPPEREEEKRYRLRLDVPTMSSKQAWSAYYLNKHKKAKMYRLGSDAASISWQTIFTESEIAEMDITGFEKIEVTP